MAIVINSSTGQIDLDQTTPNTYVVTYTVQGVSSTQEVTVNAADNATFSYSASSYLQTDPDPTPTITGLSGGTFSGSTGLVINSTTGEIDLSASTVTSHTVTYNTSSSGSSVCPNTSTQTIEIDALVEQIANAEVMSFNGTDAYIDAGNPSIFNNLTSFSFSCWFNSNVKGSDDGIFGKWLSDTNRSFALNLETSGANSNIRFIVRNTTGGAAQAYISGSDWNTGNWYNVSGTYDGSNVKLYLNGVLKDTVAFTGTVVNVAQSFRIGVYGSSSYFDGKIDEVAIFNTALSASKIQQIYDATAVVNGVPQTANLFTGGLDSSLVYWNRMGDS